MVVLTAPPPSKSFISPPFSTDRHSLRLSRICLNRRRRVFSVQPKSLNLVPHFRIRSFQHDDAETYQAAKSIDTPDGQDKVVDELLVPLEQTTREPGNSFLAKLAIALGIAATVTILSVYFKQPDQGPSLGIQHIAKGSSSSTLDASNAFTFKAFGYRVMLPESAPGWIYFWLLMAAGFGLFISEEALNIWVCHL